MIRRVRAFGAFWYDFVVGDDWRVATGVVIALTLTYAVSHNLGAPAWWIVVAAVGVLLPTSIHRAIRAKGPADTTPLQ